MIALLIQAQESVSPTITEQWVLWIFAGCWSQVVLGLLFSKDVWATVFCVLMVISGLTFVAMRNGVPLPAGIFFYAHMALPVGIMLGYVLRQWDYALPILATGGVLTFLTAGFCEDTLVSFFITFPGVQDWMIAFLVGTVIGFMILGHFIHRREYQVASIAGAFQLVLIIVAVMSWPNAVKG